MRDKINRYDIALIILIVIINVFILIYGSMKIVQPGGKVAYVYSNNELVGEYTLDEDYKNEFTINSVNGYNTIHIEDGKVWIHDASCPDKICLSQGKISNDGEIIVCLPNMLMVQIIDNSEVEDDLDIISK